MDLLCRKIPETAEELNFKSITLKSKFKTLFDEYDALLKVRDSPEMKDKYFFNMRQLDLNQLSKKCQKVIDDFNLLTKEISEYKEPSKVSVKEFGRVPSVNYNNNISNSISSSVDDFELGKDNELDVDEEYGEYLTAFIRSCLDFNCPYCHKSIPFGESTCEKCHKSIEWDYDPQEIADKLAQIPRKVILKCPKPDCGARIELDWESCAYCDLDIQRLLNSYPKFD